VFDHAIDGLPWLAKLNAHLNGVALTPISTEPLKDAIYSFVLFGMTAPQKQMLEQHIGTIMQIMVIGLLGWSLSTTVSMNREMGEFKSTVISMQGNLNAATADRYRASDAARDHAALWADIQRADARLKELTDAFNRHKSEVQGVNGIEYRAGMNGGVRK
jgi:hypothetical protein